MNKLEQLKADAARASDWASWAASWAARADAAYMAARVANQAEPEKTNDVFDKRRTLMSKLEELKAAQAALIAALDVLSAARDAYDADLKRTKEQTND